MHTDRATILAVLLLLATLGCTVGPDYEAPVPEEQVPDAWRSAAAEEIEEVGTPLETWWTNLRDPKLVELIEEARAANLSLLTAAARVQEGRARLGIATGRYYPDLVVDGSFTRTEPSENAFDANLPPEFFDTNDLWDLGVGFNWEIDVFGRLRRGAEAARADLEASIEDYRDVMVILMADVASAYVEIRTLQQRLHYAKLNVQAQAKSVQLTRDRFNAGLSPLTDVTQSEYNLANLQAGIPRLESLLAAEINRLAVLLGKPPGAVDDLLEGDSEIPSPDEDVALGIPADLLRRRPDIRFAERRLAAQTALIGVAKADLYPTFSLAGVLAVTSTESGNLFDSDSVNWSLVPGLRWNIFSAGKIRNNIRVEEARTQQLLFAYEQTVLSALDEVETTMVAYQRELERQERLLEAVGASERTVSLVETQYKSGLTGFLNLLDAQRTLATQQDAWSESEGLVIQNLIALNRALGGGWGPYYPDNTPKEDAELITASIEEDESAETGEETESAGSEP
jgi:NodT family efflux transporter outer membrane factor (OMF) lipoprotein